MQGILFALIPMVAWGSIGFVSNKIGGKPDQQTLGMTLGALVFAFVVWLFVQPEMSVTLWVVGIIGVCWSWDKMVNKMQCNICFSWFSIKWCSTCIW